MNRKDKSKGKKTHQKVVISLFAMFMLIALALGTLASPALTINTATWQQNTIINVSTKSANDDSQNNMTYIGLRGSSSTTANSSSVVFFNITNSTATNFDLGYANITFGDDIVIEDSNDYSITAVSTGTGDSDGVASSATTIAVDRTVPSAPSSTSPTANTDNTTTSNIVFNSVVNGANTSGCTLRFTLANPGQSVYPMTHSGDSCTLTINGMARSDFTYFIRASDGTNTSDSANVKFTISSGASNVARRAYAVATGGGGSSVVPTKGEVGRALGIQSSESSAKGTPFSADGIRGEITAKELTKTGIGLGTGAVVGMAIGTIVMPGIGTIAGIPLGSAIGAFLGFLA